MRPSSSRDSLKADPTNPDFNRLLGGTLTQFGKNDEAIALYKGLLERYPTNEEMIRLAHSGLSVIYVNQGDYTKGEAELEILWERSPDEPGINNDLGYLYADQGKKLEQAEAMIRKAVQEDPDNAAYLDSLGWVLFKQRQGQGGRGAPGKGGEEPAGGRPDHLRASRRRLLPAPRDR